MPSLEVPGGLSLVSVAGMLSGMLRMGCAPGTMAAGTCGGIVGDGGIVVDGTLSLCDVAGALLLGSVIVDGMLPRPLAGCVCWGPVRLCVCPMPWGLRVCSGCCGWWGDAAAPTPGTTATRLRHECEAVCRRVCGAMLGRDVSLAVCAGSVCAMLWM